MHNKLLKIQAELKVPKANLNKFGGYKYRNCEDILEAVKPLCHREGLTLTLSDEVVCVGNRNYVKATAILSQPGEPAFRSPTTGQGISDEVSAECVSVTAYAREEETKKGMDGAQITGAASSYARKYALNGLFAIDDTADADATNDHGKVAEADGEAVRGAIVTLLSAKTIVELHDAYKNMPLEVKQNKEVIEAGKTRKKELTTPA